MKINRLITGNKTVNLTIKNLEAQVSPLQKQLKMAESFNIKQKKQIDELNKKIESMRGQNSETLNSNKTDLKEILTRTNDGMIEKIREIIIQNNANHPPRVENENIDRQNNAQRRRSVVFRDYDFPDPDADNMVCIKFSIEMNFTKYIEVISGTSAS